MRTITLLFPGRNAWASSQVINTSERSITLHGTLPIDTAGTTPSPADASSARVRPSPTIETCGGEDVESVTEDIKGVKSSDALYLQPLEARH